MMVTEAKAELVVKQAYRLKVTESKKSSLTLKRGTESQQTKRLMENVLSTGSQKE